MLGRRVHEYALGFAVLGALLAGYLARAVHPGLSSGLAAFAGLWMVAKDWRDLSPSRRDTASWRLGLHRRAAALRPDRHGDHLPALAGVSGAVVAGINLASALTPNVHWRGHALLGLEPVKAVPLFHALALPASAALAVASFYLFRRRRRALHAAVALLAALGAIDILKGLDVEEAALSWSLAALLWWGRGAFFVRHDPLRFRSALVRVAALAAATVALVAGIVWIAAPDRGGIRLVARETADLLVAVHGPMRFRDELSWLPLGVGLTSLGALLAAAYLLFRPLASPRRLPGRTDRLAAADLVRTHGRDTLAFFKLRRDVHYLFSPDRRAFLAYRIESGVFLVSGDPVGPDDALPALLREACAFAETRGLRLGAVGASRGLLTLYEQAGLRALYIGDEAIVETRSFTLEGRPIRKVRQSVSRLQAAGYEAELHDLEELDAPTLAELERVSAAWRGGAAERGFAMAMDSVGGEHQSGSIVVAARDAEGKIRGFLHYVPAYGRPAMSLSFMRRDHGTPNGLMEFLVVRSIELLRERGVDELSLNFAAFARLLHGPSGWLERVLGRIVGLGDSFFQIESLYRFNAKFFPRWEPRYLLYERGLGLVRVGLATLWVEGQLPKPRLRLPGQQSVRA